MTTASTAPTTATAPPATHTAAPSEGLEGVAVTSTGIGDVRGHEGSFHYRGYDATDLARRCGVEDVWHLLLHGELPDPATRERFVDRLVAARTALPAEVFEVARHLDGPGADGDRMAALRTLWSHTAAALQLRPWLDLDPARRVEQAVQLAAVGPVLVAASERAVTVEEIVALPAGTAAAHLTLLTGRAPEAAHVEALERYLVLTADHGLNASTFAARVVTSTGADLGAALVAALGALSGPLHGGAPSRALDMLDAIGTPDRAEPWVRDAIEGGRRIMGFGHRVYRTEDPRASLLRATAQQLAGPRVELASHVEQVVRRQLRRHKPDRVLDVNVEYWAAVVLDAIGLPRPLFTPTFAVARSIGWLAHALEQTHTARLIRPSARYDGPPPGRRLGA